MRYCGLAPARGLIQLVLLEEVREAEPPVRLRAVFFDPGSAAQVASELLSLGDVVVGLGGPFRPPDPGRERLCDGLLRQRGVAPRSFAPELGRAAHELSRMGVFAPQAMDAEGPVPEGSFREASVFETNPDAVFCALRSRRLPARRHPQGVRLRIEELEHEHVLDDGGGLWNRRIEEIDAVAAGLCAHRYAVGHAWWVGAADEGVTVVPGASLPGEFSSDGVLVPVERLQLPPRQDPPP